MRSLTAARRRIRELEELVTYLQDLCWLQSGGKIEEIKVEQVRKEEKTGPSPWDDAVVALLTGKPL